MRMHFKMCKSDSIVQFIVFLLFKLSMIAAQSGLGDKCVTPDGYTGQCTTLQDCPCVLAALLANRILNLPASNCETFGMNEIGCCPFQQDVCSKPTHLKTAATPPQRVITASSKIPVSTPPTTVAPSNGSVLWKGISIHRNLHLLPRPNLRECGRKANMGSITTNIAGGTNAGLGAYPWMALIGYKSRKPGSSIVFGCDATLINDRYILTASHCIVGLPPNYSPTIVRLGEYNQSSRIDCEGGVCAPPVQDIPIEQIIPHEKYDFKMKQHDIALIRLQRPVTRNPYVSPICLPVEDGWQKPTAATPFVAGWGRTRADNPEEAQVLQRVNAPFQSMQTCRQFYETLIPYGDEDRRICAGGEQGKGSCQGDSGGGLAVQMKSKNIPSQTFQIGIVSLGDQKCDTTEVPSLYTNLAHHDYLTWVLDNIRP